MRMLRTYRVNNDCLSVWFCPRGALSTAVLKAAGGTWQVAGQLPGLRAEAALDYLAELGWRTAYGPLEKRVGIAVSAAVAGAGLFVECVLPSEAGLVLSVADLRDRRLAAPRRLFVALYDRQADHIEVVDVQEGRAAAAFLKAVAAVPKT